MNYQRILLLMELGADPQAAISNVLLSAPSVAQLTVIAHQPTSQFAWLTGAAPPDLGDAAAAALDALREAANGLAPASIEVQLSPALTADALADFVQSSGTDLVIAAFLPIGMVSILTELRKRTSVPVLWTQSAPAPHTHPGTRLLCLGVSAGGRASVVTLLRDHASPDDRAIVLSSAPAAGNPAVLPDVSGISIEVKLAGPGDALDHLFKAESQEDADLVVVPRFPPSLLLAAPPRPVLILPPLRPRTAEWERALDVPDLVDDLQRIRVRLGYAVGVGQRTPIADQEVAFVSEGRVVARADAHQGELELPTGIGEAFGVFRTHGKKIDDPVASVEEYVAVLRPGPRPLVLFDAELDDEDLARSRAVTWADFVAVRVRSTKSCKSLRSKWRGADVPAPVIDVGAVLGEGDAPDVSPLLDAVRLARAASRMRAAGFPIAAIVYRGPHPPTTRNFAAVRPEEIGALSSPPPGAAAEFASLSERLDATTGSESIAGNHIEVELDNPKARHWLLSSIEGSQTRVHFQVYMALDDDVGAPVEAALAAAGARGVTVRVLVDSLHGLHGSLGARNPILERLSAWPGVELRVSRPITGAPSLEDLKQRDHRKLVVVDGRVALLGGRNLSHEYYTGFQEVQLTPGTTWRVVPWLDAGARVEGPAVASLERSFLEAWMGTGGAAFDISDSRPAGEAAARVVVHRGLRDAYTVEAYLALIETARSHVYAVNGFPLLLEIQHALLRALKRGVRVRTLFGNLTPKYGDRVFKGPLATARTVATSFVHSRMDALVAAGADCYEFVVASQRGWDPSIGDLHPHVHAKTMSADGRVCAVGSANLDITAGYWENELLLVVEDETIARAVEARFDELIAGSKRVDRNDPEWQRRAEMRGWMRYWPGVLSG